MSRTHILIACLSLAFTAAAQDLATVEIRSSADGSPQKALWWTPATDARKPVPLLVALHSWSSDYTQKESGEYLKRCRKRGWALIHPDFRGPNRRPEACGSDLAVADIMDAVAYAREHASIDPRRIYLVGVSGGGYMTLLMAGRHPEVWAAASAWVPIFDLDAWYRETKTRGLRYAADMDAVFGGPPGENAARDSYYRRRSPIYCLTAARGLPVDVNAGIHDGHTGSVPVSHSLQAFNMLAVANGKKDRVIPAQDIAAIVETERIPESLAGTKSDPTYAKSVLFRRQAGPVRVTLFDGTHEMLMDAAFSWLEGKTKKRGARH